MNRGECFLTNGQSEQRGAGGRHSMGNISANVSEEERWPLLSNNDISKPLEDANVIGPNLPWNEENRHPDALLSDSVILLTGPLLCRLVWKSMISYHFAVTYLAKWGFTCINTRTCGDKQTQSCAKETEPTLTSCHWGRRTTPTTCQAWMNRSERRHEQGDEIIAEAGYDAPHRGGQQGRLEREKIFNVEECQYTNGNGCRAARHVIK